MLNVLVDVIIAVKVDYSCNFAYMVHTMDQLGKALQATYKWLQANQTIYLVMDNAGGHGSDESIVEYTTRH